MKETAAARPGGRHRVRLRALPAPDLPFLVLVLTLVGFGLVMLGSASGAVALYRRGDAFAYLRPQLLYAALGIAGMGLASRVDYHIFHKLAWPLLGVSLLLLTAVLFMPEYNGCKRWLVLPGLGTLQPSEIAKFAVVLVFAHIISLNHDRMQSFAVGVLPFALVLGVVAALMLLEPHLSGTLLILGIGAMWAASRVDYHIYHKLAWPLLALSLVLLVVVLFMPEYNGCKRWLVLPGLGTLQPSEIAKFAVVLCLPTSSPSTTAGWRALRWGWCPLRWYWARWRCSCCWSRTCPARC